MLKKISIINASKIEENFLIDTFITEFNEDYQVIKNINAKKLTLVTANGKFLMQIFMKIKLIPKLIYFIKNLILIMREFKVYFQICLPYPYLNYLN